MRLLVSVRSAEEAAAAVSGGAGIVDAKEPANGSLGAVDGATLREIAEALPPDMPLSIALGDLPDASDVRAALARVEGIAGRPRELYVKVGLAGVREIAAAARAVLGAVVAEAGAMELRPSVVAVAYADHQAAAAPSSEVIAAEAADAGARGVLLDTWRKDGRDLFAWLVEPELARWVGESRARGLLTALAGSLSAAGVARAARLEADIVGVRGAACAGGRLGPVEEGRVRRLAAALAAAPDRPGAVV